MNYQVYHTKVYKNQDFLTLKKHNSINLFVLSFILFLSHVLAFGVCDKYLISNQITFIYCKPKTHF